MLIFFFSVSDPRSAMLPALNHENTARLEPGYEPNLPLADPKLVERAGTLRDNGSSRHTGKDARHSKSSRLRPLASDTYPNSYDRSSHIGARFRLRGVQPKSDSKVRRTMGHRMKSKPKIKYRSIQRQCSEPPPIAFRNASRGRAPAAFLSLISRLKLTCLTSGRVVSTVESYVPP